MFRLQTALNQADALASRLFPQMEAPRPVYVTPQTLPVTENCVPARRRRTRRQAATGTSEPLRSTWF